MEVTVHEAKTHLSRLLRLVESGETIVIRRGQTRVAMLTNLAPDTPQREIWGDLRGHLSTGFDEPLEDFGPFTESA